MMGHFQALQTGPEHRDALDVQRERDREGTNTNETLKEALYGGDVSPLSYAKVTYSLNPFSNEALNPKPL